MTSSHVESQSSNIIPMLRIDQHEVPKFGWVPKCWLTIPNTLFDDILKKVAHVERGSIETLLKEIAASLTVYTQVGAAHLRLQIYGCTMQKCDSDLQSYIAYFQIRQRKLTFLKKPVAESDLVSLFINGLHPILTPLKIHLRLTAPTKWDEVVNVVRIHEACEASAGQRNYGDRCQFSHAAIPPENVPVTQQSKFIRSKNNIT